METLKQLPYLCGADRKELAPFTRALNYLNDDFAVEVWKDPFGLSEEGEKVQGYLGNCIPLTYCAGEEYGWLLLLDLHTNEVYEISNNAQTQTQIRRPPKGAPKYYYQHYPHNPAPETLKSWINKTKQLLWVPDPSTGIWMQQEKDDWNGSAKQKVTKKDKTRRTNNWCQLCSMMLRSSCISNAGGQSGLIRKNFQSDMDC
ncbi:hypothetical protein D6D05_09835 [Aureobasidium pullulans]|nr:hypothetical protein D6D05_09835 [Aureobasidium pullulans]